MKKKLLLSSILVIVLCVSLIAGSTFALFTSEQTINVAVTAGNVDIVAEILENSINTKSEFYIDSDYADFSVTKRTVFENGGEATFTDAKNLVIERMTPGDVLKFDIKVTNNSDVDVQYRVRMVSNIADGAAKDLSDALVTTVNTPQGKTAVIKEETDAAGTVLPYVNTTATDWSGVIEATEKEHVITVTIEFPDGTPAHDNEYKKAQADITFVVEAVQGNGTASQNNIYTPVN